MTKITMDDDIALDSPGEALFYGLCCWYGIPVRTLNLNTCSAEANGLAYCPRFWISWEPLELAVEVSDAADEGTMRPLRTAWRAAYHQQLAVVYREQLADLLEARRPAHFAARLRQMGRLPSGDGSLLVRDVSSRCYMFVPAGPGEDTTVQQTLYWTNSGTLACGECGTEVSTGDGKTVPYVINHPDDCSLFRTLTVIAS